MTKKRTSGIKFACDSILKLGFGLKIMGLDRHMKIRILSLLSGLLFSMAYSASSLAATYAMRSDGSAVEKAAAISCDAASTALNATTHNKTTFLTGDKIILCDDGGTYTVGLNTLSAGVTYQVADGDHVIFEGNRAGFAFNIDEDNVSVQRGSGKLLEIRQFGSDTSNQIKITGDRVTIDGLTIHDSDGGAISVGGSSEGTVIKNSVMYDCGAGSEDEFIAFTGNSHDWKVQYCEIYGNASRGVDGITLSSTYNGTIEFNYIHDIIFSDGEGGEQAIDIKQGSHNITVRYNHIKNIRDSGGMIVHSQYGDIYAIDIIGNWFDNCRDYSVLIFPRDGHDVYDVDIRANIFSDTDKSALSLSSKAAGDNWYQVRVYNNTFVNNGKNYGTGACPLLINGASTQKRTTGSGSDTISNIIKNNIFHERIYGTSRDLMFDNDSSGKYVIIAFNRFYDGNGTARCKYQGSWYDCNSGAIGSNNEIASTKFENSLSGFATGINVMPAEKLDPENAEGLREDTNWSGVTKGEIYTANRNNFNSSVWGKGAVIYGSSSSDKLPSRSSIKNPPNNLRIKSGKNGG
jgi:Right handed beta helix region